MPTEKEKEVYSCVTLLFNIDALLKVQKKSKGKGKQQKTNNLRIKKSPKDEQPRELRCS